MRPMTICIWKKFVSLRTCKLGADEIIRNKVDVPHEIHLAETFQIVKQS